MPTSAGRAPYQGFFQLGYVTTDVEQAKAEFARDHGVAKFFTVDTEQPVTTPEGPHNCKLRMAFAYVGDTQIELIQNVGEPIPFYDHFLPASGFAVVFHHLGFRLRGPVETWHEFRAGCAEAGRSILLEGDLESGKWVYTDERSRLGHYHEYMWLGPDGSRLMEEAIPRN